MKDKKYQNVPEEKLMKLKDTTTSIVYISLGLVIALVAASVYSMITRKEFDFTILVALALLFSTYTIYKKLNLIKKELHKRSAS